MTSPLATAFVLIRPTTTGFGPTLKRELDGAAGAAGAAGSKAGQSWTKGFQSSGVTKAAGKVTEGIIAIGVVSTVAAVKFQAAMEKIHTQAGVAQGKIQGLGDGILKLAGQVGFSPDSLATSLYHVESAFESMGITSVKALDLVKTAAKGAAVGGADLEDVTNALTALTSAGLPGVKNLNQAMGVLNATVGVGDMKMQDLADAFGTGLLASIKGFGVSIQDAGAALAVFGDNNIRGADAGTKLRQAIQALAAPTGAGKKILEGWGLSADRFAKDMQKGGLKLALEDLVAQFKKVGVTGKEQGQILTELFGKRAGVGVQILVGQMDRLESKYPALAKGANSFGDAWAKTQATASQQFKELGHGLEAMGVSIGEKLLPPLMAVFGFIRNNTGLFLTLAGVVGGLAVAITAVSVGIKLYKAAVEIAAAAQWLWNTALDANPIGLVIIAIAALVAGVIYAYTHFKWFRDLIGTVWDAIKIGFNWVKEHWKLLAAILFGPIGLAVDAIVTHWKFVKAAFVAVWDWLKGEWQTVYDWIIKPIGLAAKFIFGIWKSIIVSVANMIIKIKNFFAPAINWLVKAGKDVIGGLFAGMWHAVGAAASWVAKIGGTILRAVTSFFGIKSPSTVFFGIGTHLMAGLFKGMVHGASGLAKWVLSEISKLGGGIVSKLLGFLGFGSGGNWGSGHGSFGGSLGGDEQQNQALARTMFPWGGSQWPPFFNLEMAEAGFNRFARNPTSGAYGIPQALPESKLPFAGQAAGGSNATAQLHWMFDYIRGRYGDPARAWGHETAVGWYGSGLKNGLFTRPTVIGVGEQGPEMVNITPASRSGAGPVVVLEVASSGSRFDRFMADWLHDAVRVKGGGSVQVAFGSR